MVSLADFHSRKLPPGESLSVPAYGLKQLLGKAIPNMNADTSKHFLLHQYISGLPSSISKRLRAAGQINDLNTVLERAKLLMMLEGPESTAAIWTTEVEVLKEHISLLMEQVVALTTRQTRQLGNVTCYRCH